MRPVWDEPRLQSHVELMGATTVAVELCAWEPALRQKDDDNGVGKQTRVRQNGLAAVGFQLQRMYRSVDRLCNNAAPETRLMQVMIPRGLRHL